MDMKPYLAVDFDGTVVEHCFPDIGPEVPHAIDCLLSLQERYHIILWTMRDKEYLQEAVDFLQKRGIVLFGINDNPDEKWSESRKVYAHKYVDDAAVGCPLVRPLGKRPYVNWLEVMKDL